MSDTVYVLDQVGIRLVKEKTLISDKQLKRPEQVVGFVSDILREYDREVMCVICLNAKLNPVNMCICSMGAVDKAIASPREIMKTVILSNANGFIILHNHPGGSSQPSLEDIKTMGRIFRQLTITDRRKIEKMYLSGEKAKDMADTLRVNVSTIYRELKRGRYMHRNSDWTETERYSADIAEEKYQENLKAKGPVLKIGKDIELANYIEEKIADDGYSPEAALLDIKRKNLNFSVTITKQTLYKYIYDGIFMRVTADNLAIKRKRKSYHKIHRKAKRAAAGTSIEHRPVDIDTREEFGHWEMDSVMGQQGKSKNALVVLTERKTRYEKIFKVKDHTAASVVKCINSLERKWGRLFSDIFKTITVDNGTEFADCEGIEKKDKKGKKRTEVYYCHPYCSAERGSNENQNRMIRRHIPKGTNFDRKTKKDIQKVEDWLNNYPRPMFGGRSSQELYEEEMRLII